MPAAYVTLAINNSKNEIDACAMFGPQWASPLKLLVTLEAASVIPYAVPLRWAIVCFVSAR